MPKRKRNLMGPHCKDIFARYQFVCNGEYPASMVFKYGAYTVAEGEQFSVFRLPKPKNLLLVVFQAHDLVDCNILELLNSTDIKCLPSSGKENKIFQFPNNRIDCINYSFRMADELVEDCIAEKIPSNDYTVLYYARPKVDISHRYHNSAITAHSSFVLIIVVVIMLLFIFR